MDLSGMVPGNGVEVRADASPERSYASTLADGKLLRKVCVGRSGECVLKSATSNNYQANFAVALSSRFVKVFDAHGKLWDEYEHSNDVTDIKFSNQVPSILFTSCLDGTLYVYDTRCQGPVQSFTDSSDEDRKPILCFDYNKDEHILCAGTEVIREDAFLLFWDRRTSENLGGYWNSHALDITDVKFHPNHKSWMASSSIDGLINVFDLNETSEDRALRYTINAEEPVNSLVWNNSDTLSCTTTIEDFQIWNMTEAKPRLHMTLDALSSLDENAKVDYLIQSVRVKKNWFLATGSNDGTVYMWDTYKSGLHHSGHTLKDGHIDVVRTISYNSMDDIVLTGGDDGYICYWKVIDKRD